MRKAQFCLMQSVKIQKNKPSLNYLCQKWVHAENFRRLSWEAFGFLRSTDKCDYFSERKALGSILTPASKNQTHSVPLCLFTAHYFLSYKLFIEKRFVAAQPLLPFRCVPSSHIFASRSPESGDGRSDAAESSWSTTGLSVCLCLSVWRMDVSMHCWTTDLKNII